jgi:hypothetical protein
MRNDLTLDAMIKTVQRRASIPDGAFSDDDYTDFFRDEFETTIIPLVMRLREEYFVTFTDILTTGSPNEYEIPYNAIGAKLREVVYRLEGSQDSFVNVARLQPEEIAANAFDWLRPYGFYLRDNRICLYPPSTALGQTLRIYYFRRPNSLLMKAESSKILTINTNTNVVTGDTVHTDWGNSIEIDVVQGDQPCNVIGDDFTITVDNTGLIYTLPSIPTGLKVGDWISPTGYSPVAKLPHEMQCLLIQAVVCKCLEAMGDYAGLKLANDKYAQDMDGVTTMLTPRVDGNVKKIVNNGGLWDHNRTSTRRPF